MTENKASYVDRLNIPIVSINTAKTLIKNEIINSLRILESDDEKIKRNIEKQTFRLIGPAGIGKTQICAQICDELLEITGNYFEMLKIQSPVLNRDDFLIPFPVISEEGKYKKFEMLYSDFVPDETRPYGLFVIDELSRGDHNLQQLMWQVENENMIHLKKFPLGWFVVCLDNPDEAEYSVDTIEDAAGLRRKSQIYVTHSNKEFINYATKSNFYPDVISYFRSNPDKIYDERAQKNKMVYTNPASIERMSDHCWKYDPYGIGEGIQKNIESLTTIAESLFNRNSGQQFIDFLVDSSKTIKPEDILYKLQEEEVENKINMFIETRNPKLADLMQMLIQYLITNKPKIGNQQKENLVKFFTTIPIDIAAMFITEVDPLPRNSEEFFYLTSLHFELTNNYTAYNKDFYEKLNQVSLNNENDK